jgi:hypothetical protein
MITAKQEAKIQLLSDTELYPQAVEFMRGIARKLPPTQINGLLNLSRGKNTYKQLKAFVEFQYNRSTWKANERHVPDFYRRLSNKFKDLEKYALTVIALREEKSASAGPEEIQMAIAREFIQHLLAENDYMGATRAFQSAEGGENAPRGNNQGRSHNDEHSSQYRGGKRS